MKKSNNQIHKIFTFFALLFIYAAIFSANSKIIYAPSCWVTLFNDLTPQYSSHTGHFTGCNDPCSGYAAVTMVDVDDMGWANGVGRWGNDDCGYAGWYSCCGTWRNDCGGNCQEIN